MNKLCLPIYYENELKMYNMKYYKKDLEQFLENIKLLLQDRHLKMTCSTYDDINYYEYFDTPALYDVFSKIIKSEILNLRLLGLYMKTKFLFDIPANYTYDEKFLILNRMIENYGFSKNIDINDSNMIISYFYLFEQQHLFNNLTISENEMMWNDFRTIILEFFELFDIEELNKIHKAKRLDPKVAFLNTKILEKIQLEKVYKKMF